MDLFRPVFIIGVGRSGTSLLQSMLNSHPDISFTPETHFVRKYLAKSNSLNDKILQDKRLASWGVNLRDVFKKSSSNADFYEKLLKLSMNGKYIGDKDPKNVESLKIIQKYFPQAYILHIYRDPRAVIHSRMNAAWSSGRPIWQHVLAYKTQFNYAETMGPRLFPNGYLRIKYEDLISDSKNELTRICTFIGIQYDSSMQLFYNQSSEIVLEDEYLWKKEIFKPLDKETNSKWKKGLNDKQIRFINSSLAKELFEQNYVHKSDARALSALFNVVSRVYCSQKCN